MSQVRNSMIMEFKALHVSALTEETALNLEALLNNLPGIEQFRITLETQELQIVFDKERLSFQTLVLEMAKAGCPLRNINAALLIIAEIPRAGNT